MVDAAALQKHAAEERQRRRGAASGDDSSSDSSDGDVDSGSVGAAQRVTNRMVALLDAALDAVLHNIDLELALWPSAASRDERLASLVAAFTADATEGPCGVMKHRGLKAKGVEQQFLLAQLIAAKSTVPDEWVDALPVERLAPLLRRLVREGEEGAGVAARDAARVARWQEGRGDPPPATEALTSADEA
jgi:hypothetical protein